VQKRNQIISVNNTTNTAMALQCFQKSKWDRRGIEGRGGGGLLALGAAHVLGTIPPVVVNTTKITNVETFTGPSRSSMIIRPFREACPK
jgi:hypothetical protein